MIGSSSASVGKGMPTLISSYSGAGWFPGRGCRFTGLRAAWPWVQVVLSWDLDIRRPNYNFECTQYQLKQAVCENAIIFFYCQSDKAAYLLRTVLASTIKDSNGFDNLSGFLYIFLVTSMILPLALRHAQLLCHPGNAPHAASAKGCSNGKSMRLAMSGSSRSGPSSCTFC